jgi:hypothetical protein
MADMPAWLTESIMEDCHDQATMDRGEVPRKVLAPLASVSKY